MVWFDWTGFLTELCPGFHSVHDDSLLLGHSCKSRVVVVGVEFHRFLVLFVYKVGLHLNCLFDLVIPLPFNK